jgi:predicted TIM-barrel fold metal-dependent hydrolase
MRPAEMVFADGQAPEYLSAGHHNDGLVARGLFIDGQLYYRRNRSDELTQTTVDIRELYDVPARLKHMDEIGVDIQVVYPSILLHELTRRPEVEIGLCQAYNRWLSDRCKDSGGRLQWMAILPLRSMPDALAELKRVREDGAVGIQKRGYETDTRRAGDVYFHPLYEMAQDLDMPIGIHAGGPFTGACDAISKTQHVLKTSFYVQDAFVSLLMSGTCAKFPRLRFGFIEAGCGWVPNALFEANFDTATKKGLNKESAEAIRAGEGLKKPAPAAHYEEALGASRLFITCEAGENLPIIISQIGDDNIGIGTDYGHSDRAAVIYAHREVASYADVPATTVDKLTELNARNFYGLK